MGAVYVVCRYVPQEARVEESCLLLAGLGVRL